MFLSQVQSLSGLLSPLVGVSVGGVHAGLVSSLTHVVLTSGGRHASLWPHHMVRPAAHNRTNRNIRVSNSFCLLNCVTCSPSDQYLTSAHIRGRRDTGVWGPSLSGAQRVAHGGTCPAWHRWASDRDRRPHQAPDLKRSRNF